MVVVIVAIFFVTRMLGGSPQGMREAGSPVAAASSSSAAAADVSSVASSSAASPVAPSAVAEARVPASSASSAPQMSAETVSTGPAVQVVDAGTMSQQSRRGFLLTLIQQGVLTGVQALDTPPKVGVTPLFEGLSPNLQQQFIAVVYAYINNGAAGTQTLQLIDSTNGSQVGSYSASNGLKLSES